MARRRKTEPPIETPPPAETAELRASRAGVMKQINRIEWEFDRRPTTEGAAQLRRLRRTLNDLELEIAEISEEAAIKKEIVRSFLAVEGVARVGELGDTHSAGNAEAA